MKLLRKLRHICALKLQRNPIRVGGGHAPNFVIPVVQIDESQMHHRQRVMFTKSYFSLFYINNNEIDDKFNFVGFLQF